MVASRPPVEAVLCYDGECPHCAHAGGALTSVPRVVSVSWHDAETQQLLEAQFGEVPAAMVLLDRSSGQVYAGRTAVAELANRAETAGVAERFAGPDHAHGEGEIGDAFAGTDPADAAGIHSLTPAARARLPALIATAETADER